MQEGDKRSGLRYISSAGELWQLIDEQFQSAVGPDLSAGIPSSLHALVSGRLKIVRAAGGLVFNDRSELLFIRRFGTWDLPKGKLKKTEKPEQAAIREVEEETGLTGLLCGQQAGITYHVYCREKEYSIKETTWFDMSFRGRGNPVPQQEESITEVRWMPLTSAAEVLVSTYRSLREFTMEYLERKGITG